MSDVAIGNELVDYQFLVRLGGGVLGHVYRVRHKMLHAERAMRVVPREVAELAGSRGAGLDQAQALRGMRHRNLVRHHECGELEDRSLYFLTELLSGESLRARLRRAGALPVRDALKVARDLAAGLTVVHAEGLIHGDISPSNVLLAREQGVEVPKLIDFGHVQPRDGIRVQELARAGRLLVKVRYAAPEQLGDIGPGQRIDARCDVYSLGLLLHELLSGIPVFDQADTRSALAARLGRSAPRPSRLALQSGISKDLDDLVVRMLAPRRADRPADAGEVTRHLDELLLEVRTRGATAVPRALRAEVVPSNVDERRTIDPATLFPASPEGEPRGEPDPAARPVRERDGGTMGRLFRRATAPLQGAAAPPRATVPRAEGPSRQAAAASTAPEPATLPGPVPRRPERVPDGHRRRRAEPASGEVRDTPRPRDEPPARPRRPNVLPPEPVEVVRPRRDMPRPTPAAPVRRRLSWTGLLKIPLLVGTLAALALVGREPLNRLLAEWRAEGYVGPDRLAAGGSHGIDAQRLESALRRRDPQPVMDWLSTFPHSSHRERAYMALLDYGMSRAAVCRDARRRAMDPREVGDRFGKICAGEP